MAQLQLYSVLGVECTSSPAEIKAAYRARALRLHPDKNPSDPVAAEKFQELHRAYATLSDDAKRKIYDETGDVQLAEGGQEDASYDVYESVFSGLDDMFDIAHLFRNFDFASPPHPTSYPSPRSAAASKKATFRPQKNTMTTVRVSSRELRDGAVKKVTASMNEGCVTCEFSGIREPSQRVRSCPVCSGTGNVLQHIASFASVRLPCGHCSGSGVFEGRPTVRNMCNLCAGSGAVDRTRSLDFRIPPGVQDGKTYTWRRENSGDLIVRIEHDDTCKKYAIEPSTGEVSVTLTLTLEEVLTGFEKTVDVFGDLKTVQSGRGGETNANKRKCGSGLHRRFTNPSKPVVLKGGGLPPAAVDESPARKDHRGDFVVKFEVAWPDDDEGVSLVARRLHKYNDVIQKIMTG